MNKQEYNEDRMWIILAIAIFSVFAIIIMLTLSIFYFTVRENDNFVKTTIPQFTYTEENSEFELVEIQKLNAHQFLSYEAKGAINKAATEISYMFGNDMIYNHFFAHALYYLNKTGNSEDCLYLSNNYIGRLYANGCYKSAKVVLDQLAKNYKISDFSVENQASYYLTYADVAQLAGDNSSYYLSTAKDIIALLPNSGNKKLNQAKADILAARQFIIEDDYEKANIIMSIYTENEDFGLGDNQVYVVCNYKIPYYEIMTKIRIHENEYKKAYHYADLYITNCDTYEFRAMKLNLLQYIVENMKIDERNYNDKYSALEKRISKENLAEMTEEYGSFLLTDVYSTIDTLEVQDTERKRFIFNLALGIILLYILFLGYCFLHIFINHINKDALTQLNNRIKYENIRAYCEKKHIPYCMLMIDIDDFKKVNDTYGHAAGDEVLRIISKIIIQYTGRGISAYRYGGEELCMIMINIPERRARIIAEEIRRSIANPQNNKPCCVSVSIGVGVSKNGENVFQQADQNLYTAKRNGKNQVV